MAPETPCSGATKQGRMNVMRHLIGLGANPAAIAFCMTTLGASMMNNMFSFYYVKLFLNKYQISEGAFQQSQLVYMIWNAVNDPLFGYIQDNSRAPCCARRRLSILYGAPLYSLAFLLAWFPWRPYGPGDWLSGLHLAVALCAFDGMLTFVLLAQCALFAEISGHHQSRLRLIKYNQVASLIGSSSVLFCSLYSRNMEDYPSFQSAAVAVAVLSCLCMLYTGVHSESRFDNKSAGAPPSKSPPPSSSATEPSGDDQTPGQPALSFSAVISMTWQIMSQRNFVLFVLMNFFQVFMLAFFNNFTMIFTEHLIPAHVLPPLVKSVMYGAGFICPQVLVLGSQRLLLELGYYRMILYTFYAEAAMALVMLALGPQHHHALAFFLTANMVIIQAAFSLFNLPLADIIDRDLQKYKRSSPLSSMVFGTNALFTKPAQSLAPMLVVSVLNQFNYEDLKDITRTSSPQAVASLHSIMFYLVCLVPLVISITQAMAWRPFSIRNSHTVDTKYIDG